MPQILVSPEELRSTAETVHRSGAELKEVQRCLHRSAASLRWEAATRAVLEHRFGETERLAAHLANQAEELAAYLSRSAQRFEEADQQAIADLAGSANVLRQVLADLLRFGALAGIAGLPLALLRLFIGNGSLFGDGGSNLPCVTPNDVDGPLRDWTKTNAIREGPVNRLLQLGQLLFTDGPTRTGSLASAGGLSALHFEHTNSTTSGSLVHLEKGNSIGDVTYKGSVSVGNLDVTHTLLNSSVKASAVQVKADANWQIDEHTSVGVEASGRLGVASAGYDLNADDGDLGVHAYVAKAEGDASFQFKFFDWNVKLGVSGCAACVGVGIDTGAQGEVKLAGLLGLGINWDIS